MLEEIQKTYEVLHECTIGQTMNESTVIMCLSVPLQEMLSITTSLLNSWVKPQKDPWHLSAPYQPLSSPSTHLSIHLSLSILLCSVLNAYGLQKPQPHSAVSMKREPWLSSISHLSVTDGWRLTYQYSDDQHGYTCCSYILTIVTHTWPCSQWWADKVRYWSRSGGIPLEAAWLITYQGPE